MSTTARRLDVTVESLAEDVTELLLQRRRVFLKHRAPSDKRDHQLRRDIACGKAKPVEMLLRVSLSDLEDGLSLAAAIRPYQAIIDMLTARAAERRFTDLPPLLPVVQRETRAQAALDEAQHEILATPESIAAMDRVLDASVRYDREQDAMVRVVRERRARSAVRRSVAGAA